MKKTILIGMLVLVMCIGFVSARLGNELVTCGDFTCNTAWVGFTDTFNWTWDGLSLAMFNAPDTSGSIGNLSQSISIKPNTLYNVTINVSSFKSLGQTIHLTVFLGDVKKQILDNTNPYTVFSFNVTTQSSNGLFIEALVGSFRDNINVSSISVKEILPDIKKAQFKCQVNRFSNINRCQYRAKTKSTKKVSWLARFFG